MTRLKFKKQIFLLSIIIFSFLILSQPAFAWKIPVEISTTGDNGEKVYNKLVVGVEPDAMDGFDNLWDTRAMLSHPDQGKLILRAYLSSKDKKGNETNQLWKDIKGTTTGDKAWDINIESVPAGKSVGIKWDVPDVLITSGERLLLRDNDKTGLDGRPVEIDVTEEAIYSYISDGADTRSLTLTLSKEVKAKSKKGSSSGMGCGTITYGEKPPSNGSDAFLSMLLLLSPLFITKVIRIKIRKFYNYTTI